MASSSDDQNESMTPFEKVKTFWEALDQGRDYDEPWWDNSLFEYITPISAFLHDSAGGAGADADADAAPPDTSTVLYLLTVPQALCNRMGNLHGGAAATIFDVCTSVAVAPISRDGFWRSSGVSRSLSVTYLKAIRQGSRVIVACDVVGLGARLGFMRARMRAIKPHLLDGVDGFGRDLTGMKEGLTEAQLCQGPMLCVGEHGKVNTDPPTSSSSSKGLAFADRRKAAAARSNL